MHHWREMEALGFRSTCRHLGRDCSHRARWEWRLATKPKLIWSEAPDRSECLRVCGSLPKFMFGSNVHLFTNNEDLRTSLVTLSEFVCDIAQVKFDAFVANVTRVDYCHDWRLTRESVNEYLWALRNVLFRRIKRHLIDNETIELRNMGQTITFYDKFAERSAMRLKRCARARPLCSAPVCAE